MPSSKTTSAYLLLSSAKLILRRSPHKFATALAVLTTSFHPALSFSSAAPSFFFIPRSYLVRSPDKLNNWRGGAATAGDPATTSSSSFCLGKRQMSTTAEDTTTTTAGASAAAAKLDALRSKLSELDMDIYLVPTDDPHLSEYVPDAYKRREFLSGFRGSAGTAVVSQSGAWLWTDSRYWNEATLQLDANHWTLMKTGLPSVATIPAFLADLAVKHYQEHHKPLRVGMDPFVHAASFCKELQEAFKSAALQELNIETEEIGILETSQPNLVDPIWGDDRPPIPTSPFRVHPLEYAGMSVQDKVAKIRKEMQEKKASLAVFCTLDDVAYLLNVRAMGDVETCPVGIAYATVSMDQITLYCDSAKVQSPDVQEHLSEVTIKPYDSIVEDLIHHCQEGDNRKVWIDKSRANYALSVVIPEKSLLDSQNAITPMKACKNDIEMEGMRRAHLVDGAAMAQFMAWLEHTITVEQRAVSEVEIDLKLTGYRSKQPGFMEVSFPTIAGVGSNGAIIHYRAKEGTDLLKYLDQSNPILIDSGGQDTYGTTDVTRTWHFGTPTDEFVDAYTRVLKGNIGLDRMVFPDNTPGFVLDVMARRSLWDAGKDYGHGTGHGVGAALNVHEGPHSISPRWTNKELLKKGMIVSNEPGYYEDGVFGVRIENLLEIRYVKPEYNEEAANGDDAPATKKSNEKKFLRMEKLTMIPIQKNLINLNLMSSDELDWLDDYHQTVLEKVAPLLEPDSAAVAWLRKSCEPIDRSS